jgi:hypothetical protein
MNNIKKTDHEKEILLSVKEFMPILQQFQLIADRLDDAVSVLYERGVIIERGSIAFHKALRKEKECQAVKFYEPWNNAGIIVQEPPAYLLSE